MPLSPATFVLGALACLAPQVPSHPDGATRTNAEFGYVLVDPQDSIRAFDAAREIHRTAKIALALPDIRIALIDARFTTCAWGSAVDGVVLYPWTFKREDRRGPILLPLYLMGHEVGHDLFIRYLVPSTRTSQYGGDAPDWLDEMAGIAFENESLRIARRREAVRYRTDDLLPSLRRYFSMTHPEFPTTGQAPVGSDGLSSQPFSTREPISGDTRQFYAMTSALYEFLVEHTGSPSIIADLAAAFRRGEALDAWLLARTGHDRSAAGLDALNAAFLSWLDTDPRYGGKGTPPARLLP